MYGVIIGLDIEKYSSTSRTDELEEKRARLTEVLERSICDLPVFQKKEVIDTGDGAFILIDTSDYESVLLGLNCIADTANTDGSIRFRGVAHLGKYSKTTRIVDGRSDIGFVGDGINKAARYLDSSCLKELLKRNTGLNFVYGISQDFYEQVYDQKYYTKDLFSKYGFLVKEYSNYIYLNTRKVESLPIEEKIISNSSYELQYEYSEELLQCDFVYQPNGDISNLDTFWVFPDLLIDKPEVGSNSKISSEDFINSIIVNPRNITIAGDDQCGKSSLCKKIYSILYNSKEYLTVMLKFKSGEKGNINNKIDDALIQQYGKKRNDRYYQYEKYLILDDFYKLDNVDQKKIIEAISKMKNTYAVIIVDIMFIGSIEKRKITENYQIYTVTEFGHSLRTKLIEKWFDYNCIHDDNYCSKDELSEYVDTTFVKGIIPYTPFYILTVLAAKSDFVPLNSDLTSKGHCYQALIYISLRRQNIPDNQIGAFLNIYENIAFYFYKNKVTSISENDLLSYIGSYSEKYNMPFEIKHFFGKTNNSQVFYRNSIGQYAFYASYLLQYFVAKYLADHISEKEILSEIGIIYNNLQVKDNAYIGIFLIHHSKDIRLIDEVLINTMVLYDGIKEISLTKDEMHHVDEYAMKINAEVIEEYDRSEEKRKLLDDKLDETDEANKNNADLIEEKESDALKIELNELSKAMRTIEVLGHIVKNHSGEIEKKHLKDCYLNAVNAYRRICSKYLSMFQYSEEEYVKYIVERIQEMKENSFSREEISDLSHRFFTYFNLTMIYATIKRSADAMGSIGIVNIIKEVTSENDNPYFYCVYLQCMMWYKKELPIEEASRKYRDFPISVQHVIQKLLKEYTDLHHIPIKEKQQIASKFNMKIEALEYNYEK